VTAADLTRLGSWVGHVLHAAQGQRDVDGETLRRAFASQTFVRLDDRAQGGGRRLGTWVISGQVLVELFSGQLHAIQVAVLTDVDIHGQEGDIEFPGEVRGEYTQCCPSRSCAHAVIPHFLLKKPINAKGPSWALTNCGVCIVSSHRILT
jgi:hypothetical protein